MSDIKNLLADKTEFKKWEKECVYSKTYHVASGSPNATDSGKGTEESPFKTIQRAAEILKPGEKVIIHAGVYRESIQPQNGGTDAEHMISYEAAEGQEVIVKGSVEIDKGWEKSQRWNLRRGVTGQPSIWQVNLDGNIFGGYNPFGMVNLPGDYACVPFGHVPYETLLLRRGMVFVDGQPLDQVKNYSLLGKQDGTFWVEHDGLTIHVRLKNDEPVSSHLIEITTKEQLFSPKKTGLGYIKVKGITFEHVGNGNPVPQRGAVSTHRGHHWIIEGCTVRWVNSLGIDVGNECWNASLPEGEYGETIVRGNTVQHCGVCGLAAYLTKNLLVEDNLFEHIGWQRSYYAAESAGIKVLHTENMLFRRNVVRHIIFCAGLWLDSKVENNRITGNVFADMPESFHGIQIEANRDPNMLDNNIIWGIGQAHYKQKTVTPDGTSWNTMDKNTYGSGIYCQGSDELTIVNNLIGDCSHSGFHADTVPYRLYDGRGGTARDMKIFNNIFADCKEAAIDFDNEHNDADGNVYIDMYPGGGYLRILNPDPAKWLDIKSWRKFYGWDIHGAVADAEIKFDSETLKLSVKNVDGIEDVAAYTWLNMDFFGNVLEGKRCPGPFYDLVNGFDEKNIDPRKITEKQG